MAKKSNSLSLIYGIGMLLAAIGFCLPIFQYKIIGTQSITGFDLVGDGDTTIKIFTLLIFVGAIAGVVAAFLPIPQAALIKVIALCLSIVSFIVVIIMMSNSDSVSFIKGIGLGEKAFKMVMKSLYVGAYMIFAGWIVAIIGIVLKK